MFSDAISSIWWSWRSRSCRIAAIRLAGPRGERALEEGIAAPRLIAGRLEDMKPPSSAVSGGRDGGVGHYHGAQVLYTILIAERDPAPQRHLTPHVLLPPRRGRAYHRAPMPQDATITLTPGALTLDQLHQLMARPHRLALRVLLAQGRGRGTAGGHRGGGRRPGLRRQHRLRQARQHPYRAATRSRSCSGAWCCPTCAASARPCPIRWSG